MARKELPSPATLRQLLTYNPQTGKLFWRERPRQFFKADRDRAAWNARYAGQEAFTNVSTIGYSSGAIFGRTYYAHRVIFAMVHDRWPADQIDHLDRDRTNNSIGNLREATHAENQRNQSLLSTNTSGHSGVFWRKARGRWCAYIGVGLGKRLHLGSFTTREEAIAARASAEREYDYRRGQQTRGDNQ